MNREKWFAVNYLALVSVLTIISVVVIRLFAPSQFPAMLFVVPLFFCLTLGVMVFLKRLCAKRRRDAAFFFLEYRIVKLLMALVLIVVYAVAVRDCLLSFAITFAVFYMSVMTFETVHFIKGERKS